MKCLVIAGASSSSGKTLIACGLLALLRRRGFEVCAYKTGPDYIDTEYLRRAGRCEAYNLDTWLTSDEKVRELFFKTSAGKDFAVIEGAMGLYDGGENSTAHIAKILNAPVILILNAKSLGESAAAVALGFKEYDKDLNIAGVILNFIGSEAHEKIIADSLKKIGVKLLGAVKRDKAVTIPERHLGLLPVFENKNKFDLERLADLIEANINIEELLGLSSQKASPWGGAERSEAEGVALKKFFLKNNPSVSKLTSPLAQEGRESSSTSLTPCLPCLREGAGRVARRRLQSEAEGVAVKTVPRLNKKIAVARDEAFSFYYPESLEALKNLGTEIIFFSPLNDKKLPEAEGYIFGGGFPEIFASELSKNLGMLESVRACSKKILAECGGLMYLCRSIKIFDGTIYKMVGTLPFDSFMTDRPVVGYMEARALKDNILCEKNFLLRGHEFHYSRIEPEFLSGSCAFELTRPKTGATHKGGYAHENILASYLHLNFYGNSELAENFLNGLT